MIMFLTHFLASFAYFAVNLPNVNRLQTLWDLFEYQVLLTQGVILLYLRRFDNFKAENRNDF